MKKFLGLVVITSSLLLVWCSKSPATQTTVTTSTNNDRQNKDFGMYTGREFSINQTKDLYDFRITLNKIIIGNQNFGKYEDGYAGIITTWYISQWIIGDFTVMAKITTNMSTLQFGIGWKNNGWGEQFNGAVYQWKLSTWAARFWFFQDGLDIPLLGNESKNIKVFMGLGDQWSGNGPYTFTIGDYKYATDTTNKWMMAEFDLSQYLTY